MKMIVATLIAALLVPIARGETTTDDTPAGVVSNFIREVSVLATNHAELADFPEYVKRLEAQSHVEFKKDIKPFAVSFDRNTTPVLTKRRVRPSDCGTNGILLQFVLDDGTQGRQAPLDTVTSLPNLKLTLYAEVVLWEKAGPELRKQFEDIIGRHKVMLLELDKKAANKAPKDTVRKLAEPEARRIASDFANDFLKDKTFEDAGRTRHRYETFSPTTWRIAEQTNGRWVLKLDPPDGVYATVSMSTNGTEVRMESYGFAPN